MMNKKYLFVITYLICSCIIFSFLCLPLVVITYDWLWGNQEVNQYLEKEVANRTNSEIVAKEILNFTDQKNGRISWFYDKKTVICGVGWCIYDINGSYSMFLRGGETESWILKTGQGNCGETAWFFTKMMNRSGYSANIINLFDRNGPGHTIAEYRDEKNNRVFVDQFAGSIIPDIFVYTSPWVYAEISDFQDNTYDTTESVIENASRITIREENKSILNSRIKIGFKQEGVPFGIRSFSNDSVQMVFLKNQNYTFIEELDLVIIRFSDSRNLTISDDLNLTVDVKRIIRHQNISLTDISLIGLGIIIMRILYPYTYLKIIFDKRKHSKK